MMANTSLDTEEDDNSTNSWPTLEERLEEAMKYIGREWRIPDFSLFCNTFMTTPVRAHVNSVEIKAVPQDTLEAASRAITKALPQIRMQAQFIFESSQDLEFAYILAGAREFFQLFGFKRPDRPVLPPTRVARVMETNVDEKVVGPHYMGPVSSVLNENRDNYSKDYRDAWSRIIYVVSKRLEATVAK